MDENIYSIKNADNIYELITNIKRTPEKIGPYFNISVFEALNRIGSDLVLLSGATKLFDGELEEIKPESILLRMGSSRGFDFEVNLSDGKIVYGEAFNASESFCISKMRSAIHKLIDKNPDKNANQVIVFINEEVTSFIEKYYNAKEKGSTVKINRVYCGPV